MKAGNWKAGNSPKYSISSLAADFLVLIHINFLFLFVYSFLTPSSLPAVDTVDRLQHVSRDSMEIEQSLLKQPALSRQHSLEWFMDIAVKEGASPTRTIKKTYNQHSCTTGTAVTIAPRTIAADASHLSPVASSVSPSMFGGELLIKADNSHIKLLIPRV